MRRLLFWTFICPYLVFSQLSYKEEKIIFSDNVVSDAVFGTFKKDGFLYVATQKGLYLYDGYIFVSDKNVTNGIHHFYTDDNTIFLEENGTGLVSVKDIYSEKRILKSVVYTDSNQDNDHFENIYKDAYGNIWCSDFHNIKYLSPENQIRTFVINKDNKHLNLDVNYFPVKEGLLITSDFGIFLWNKNTARTLTKIRSEKITSSVLYNEKTYVVNHLGNICEFSLVDKKLKELPFESGGIRFVQNIEDGTPLIAYSQNTVYELDFRNHSKHSIYASEEKINHVFYDHKSGIFWISTQNGLIKLIREKEIIRNIDLPFRETVTSILETEKGVFWFSDGNGNIICKKNNDLHTFAVDEKTYQMSFSKGQLLIGAENGVYSINPGNLNSSFRKIISTPEKIKKALIHKGKIWALPESGKIRIYDEKTFQEIPDFIRNNLTDYYKTAVYNDIIVNNGRIWIASWLPQDYGITFFDEDTNLLKQLSVPNKGNPEFVGDYYNRVNRLNDGSLIFSAYGGWNVVSENGKILKSILVNSFGNVADNNIQGMAEDMAGNLWFGCAEGLYRYNEKSGSIIRISRKDGLASNNLIYGFLLGSDSQIYFSTEKNVQKIDLKILQKLKLFEELKITGIRINDDFITNIPNRIEIPEASSQRIDIYFSVLNFWGKDKIKYRYHFGDNEWKDLGDEPKLSLVKLSHGDYNITIEAYDDLEGSHNKQIDLKLSIVPPFYKTLWFIALVILCSCAIIFGITHYLIRKEKQAGKLMKRIKENENKMLRSQMNPHFLFNSLNSINSFIIQSKQNEATGYLTSFSKLMRKILDNSRKDTVSLKDELEATKLYLDLEAVRLENKFDYSITIDKKINEEEVMIPALILQPFLENSVWHGINPKIGNGFIEIRIDGEDNGKNPFLNIRIEDNGIGRKAASKHQKEMLHKSHGMDITLERLQMSDPKNKVEITDIYNDKNEAAGTLVKIKIYYDHD